jgi:hypothetical protein
MNNNKIFRELKSIKAILAFSNFKIIEEKLGEIIRTKPRRLIWIYCDGERTQTEIASLVGVTQQAVSLFVNEAEVVGIIDNSGKGPLRVIDYIPPLWMDLIANKKNVTLGIENEEKKAIHSVIKPLSIYQENSG